MVFAPCDVNIGAARRDAALTPMFDAERASSYIVAARRSRCSMVNVPSEGGLLGGRGASLLMSTHTKDLKTLDLSPGNASSKNRPGERKDRGLDPSAPLPTRNGGREHGSPIEVRGLINSNTQRVRNPIPMTVREMHGMCICFYETGGELVCVGLLAVPAVIPSLA